jgi:hypothetical protein
MAAARHDLSKARKRWVLAATVLGSSLTFIDGSALGVALPSIQRDLGAGPAAVQWVSNAYLLTLGALVLIGGAAGDRFGRRAVFLIGVTVFALASIACGLVPTVELLIAGRAVQGIGAALLTPGALAVIGSVFPPEERGKAFGAWAGRPVRHGRTSGRRLAGRRRGLALHLLDQRSAGCPDRTGHPEGGAREPGHGRPRPRLARRPVGHGRAGRHDLGPYGRAGPRLD